MTGLVLRRLRQKDEPSVWAALNYSMRLCFKSKQMGWDEVGDRVLVWHVCGPDFDHQNHRTQNQNKVKNNFCCEELRTCEGHFPHIQQRLDSKESRERLGDGSEDAGLPNKHQAPSSIPSTRVQRMAAHTCNSVPGRGDRISEAC